jgi:Spy/CpxP family protein refolding chaperone
MKTKIIIIILIVSLGINVGIIIRVVQHRQYMENFDRREHFIPPSFPPSEREHFPSPPKHDLEKSLLSRTLKLNNKQINAIEEMHLKTNSKIDPVTRLLDLKRKELIGLLKEDNLDKVKADTLFKEISALQSKIEFYLFENMCQMKEILTPLQQQKFFELLQSGLFGKDRSHMLGPRGEFEPEHSPGNREQPENMFPPDGPGPNNFPQKH